MLNDQECDEYERGYLQGFAAAFELASATVATNIENTGPDLATTVDAKPSLYQTASPPTAYTPQADHYSLGAYQQSRHQPRSFDLPSNLHDELLNCCEPAYSQFHWQGPSGYVVEQSGFEAAYAQNAVDLGLLPTASSFTPAEDLQNSVALFNTAKHPGVQSKTTTTVSRKAVDKRDRYAEVKRRGRRPPYEQVFRLPQAIKKARFDEVAREATKQTRSRGACETCREKKKRCRNDPNRPPFVPCESCLAVPISDRTRPCVDIDLTRIQMFRLGATLNPEILLQWTQSHLSSLGQHYQEASKTWIVERPKPVRLTFCATEASFQVTVVRYQPTVDDVTAFGYCDDNGISQSYELPPYCIYNMQEAMINIRQFLDDARSDFLRIFLDKSHPIIRKVYHEAERFCNLTKSPLLDAALKLWSATRMTEYPWLICGDELLDLPPIDFCSGPFRPHSRYFVVPATPVMDTQLDELVISTLLIPLGNQVLHLLKAKMLARKKEDWYEIYLATFMVLLNLEFVVGNVVDYSKQYDVPADEDVANGGGSLSEAYYHACKIILAFFHFATGGTKPFASSSSIDGILDEQQKAHVQDIKQELQRNELCLSLLRHESMHKTELYWCYQMFDEQWKADTPHVGQLLRFTEKQFLVT